MPTTKPAPEPPLVQQKRLATTRLHEIARLLSVVEREYLAAAAECDRLRAPRPASAERAADAGGPPDGVEVLDPRVSALQNKLRRAEADLAAAEARNRELQRRVLSMEAHRAEFEGQAREPPEDWRGRLTALESELREAQAGSASLREDMANLLTFLGDLSETLSGPSDQTGEA